MVQFNFDEHNIEAYEARTEEIESAIDLILNTSEMKLTVSELARVTGFSRNTLKVRGFNSEKLREIQSKCVIPEESKEIISDAEQLQEAKSCIAQLQLEIGFWFSRAVSAYEIKQDYKKQADRTRDALNSTKKDVDNLKFEVAKLIDERNKLQEIIRELS
ncbi:hypothetical protein [Pseudoalteromonas sp. CH_XMU1449-3]|uniref:hypothetical protein n=1 Tax=Pseudoalteromonas sp. CH_XMU1449-3 TaxID=3107774 RepID=UPI00300AFC34